MERGSSALQADSLPTELSGTQYKITDRLKVKKKKKRLFTVQAKLGCYDSTSVGGSPGIYSI